MHILKTESYLLQRIKMANKASLGGCIAHCTSHFKRKGDLLHEGSLWGGLLACMGADWVNTKHFGAAYRGGVDVDLKSMDYLLGQGR